MVVFILLIYVLSVILALLSVRFLYLRGELKDSELAGFILASFMPIIEWVILAYAISDIIEDNQDTIARISKKILFIKDDKKKEEI